MRLINYYSKQVVNLLGQLLVVARHTDTSPSSCYEPELIPDPDGQYFTTANLWIWDQW